MGKLLADSVARLVGFLAQTIARLWRRPTIRPSPPVAPALPSPRADRLARRQGPRPSSALTALPYQRAPSLLTKGERAFWHPLYHAVKGKYRLFCKVRLADVVCCPPERRDERQWFRKIGRYHVDFVLCDPHTTAPLLVVELDDRGHRQKANRERDDFKDAVLRSAGLPICRIPVRRAYDPEALKRQIEELIGPPGPMEP